MILEKVGLEVHPRKIEQIFQTLDPQGVGALDLDRFLICLNDVRDSEGFIPEQIEVGAERMTGMDGACMHQPTLRGSFSAVSKPIFVNKYFFRGDYTSAFFEIYRRPYRAKKKCEHFSSPPKKTFG